MPLNFLGRKLFPRQQSWLQRRRVNTILVTLLVALLFAVIVGALMFLSNARR
jgi:predicted PurR-regulated permease PerM